MICRTCGFESDDLSLFKTRTKRKLGAEPHCKRCTNAEMRQRRRDRWKLCFEYMGSKCHDCGLVDDCPAIYDMHHLNPDEKEYSVGHMISYKWETHKKELDKCVMLCANCHRRRHYVEEDAPSV